MKLDPHFVSHSYRTGVIICSMAAKIWETPEWAALKAHADGEIANSHLRELMKASPFHRLLQRIMFLAQPGVMLPDGSEC